MGVYGLTQYVKQNMPNLGIRTNVLSLKTIVVDGNSFCFYIAKKINWLKGSQYHEFITLIKRHLEVFTNSQTELIFVFDGPLPDYKIEERHSRNQDKIEKLVLVIADAISNRNPDYHVQNLATSLLPPFAIPIAIHTMKELNFKCIVAEEEADLFIARLANSLNASVLSQDSDFFMFNIPSFILLDT
ncbi:PIN domain-like protein [Globomyces pollinis-pini]|nr:PIN domain-like protein [Globomyces pollinis-pini]